MNSIYFRPCDKVRSKVERVPWGIAVTEHSDAVTANR